MSHCAGSSMTMSWSVPLLTLQLRCAFVHIRTLDGSSVGSSLFGDFKKDIDTTPHEIDPCLLLIVVNHSVTRCAEICLDCPIALV